MPITAIDPRTALIVVDLQVGTLGNPTVHPVADIVTNSTAVLAAFRARGLPIVLANVTGTPAGRNDYGGGARSFPDEWSSLIPELRASPEDILVTRDSWDAFVGTDLQERLDAEGVTQVVIVGVATSFGVESTARHAYDLGYNVVVVTDAVTDMRAEAHENSVARIFPILGETATAAEVQSLLTRD